VPRATVTDAVKLVLVEALRGSKCVNIHDVARLAAELLGELGVQARPEAILKVAKSIVSKRGRELGACWAPGKPGTVCRCGW